MTDEIKTLASKVVYQNKWMTVREDTIVRESGAQGIYGVVEKPPFVVILPIADDHIYLVEQYRYAVKGRYWELPQGAWETRPDAAPEIIAAGELKEETGLSAEEMLYVGNQFLAYGFCDQQYHIFIARNLTKGTNRLDSEEEGLICRAFKLSEFERMIIDGDIRDATSVNAYGLAKLRGCL